MAEIRARAVVLAALATCFRHSLNAEKPNVLIRKAKGRQHN